MVKSVLKENNSEILYLQCMNRNVQDVPILSYLTTIIYKFL
jgi:hypothetical protein